MMPRNFQSLRLPVLVLAFLCLADGIDVQRPKSKRQIYREQVLPSKGGKIPDGAFRTDRLALNRLNKEGIAIPDGVLLEHRLVHSHPHINKHDPEDEAAVIQIIQKEENRFVAAPGKYHHRNPLTIPSTYIIRKPIGPESTVLRIPPQQTPHRIFPHHFPTQQGYGPNGGYHRQQFLPQIPHHLPQVTPSPHRFPHLPTYSPVTYNPVEIPFKKYLPTGPSHQKYSPTAFSLPDKKFLPPGYTPTVVRHPHPQGYEAPISYQSVSYFPIHAPLVLPNKELQTNEYYRVKGNGNHGASSGAHSKEIHDTIDWTALLAHYSQVSNKLEALNHESYGGSATSQTKFVTPEVLGPIDSGSNYYSENVGRYVRKSKESNSATDSNEDPKLRCNNEEGNAVEDGSTPCPP